MTTTQAAPAARPKFDNHGQYSRAGILRYEMIFGEGYVSTGGAATTNSLCIRQLGTSLRPGVRVLDVGSGISGAAFHTTAQTYGARVTGIDLAEEMVAIALERTAQLGMSKSVTFLLGDVLDTPFAEPFDVIWSRDAFMHIPDKPRLFRRLHQLLQGGGRLVITDYARGKDGVAPSSERYIETTGYHVVEPERVRPAPARTPDSEDVVAGDATSAVHRDSPERGGPAGHQPGRVPHVVLGSGPHLSGRALAHETAVLPRR